MSEPIPAPARPLPLWPTLVGAVALVLAVYLPSMRHAQFLDFDDNLFFDPGSGALRDGLLAVLDPRRTIANVYLPVSNLSLYLDWWLFGGSPLGPHLVSLLLHALAATALVRWLLAMRLPVLAAHAVGAVFLLHPALAESAAWVSGRKDILSGLFVFLALGSTVRFAARPSLPRLVGIAALTVLAMYSKATAMVLPGLALLVCLYLRGLDRRRFWAPAVMLLVTLPILWHHAIIAAGEGTMAATAATTFWQRLPQAPGALRHYLLQTFWPRDLNILYPEVQTLARFRQAPASGLLLLAAAVATSLLAFGKSRFRLAGLGMLLLLAALLPFNTVFPASAIAAADRYLYLAIPGAALFAVALLCQLPRHGAVVGMALALPLAVLTVDRAFAFQSSDAAWRASIAVDADNAVAQLNYAGELQRQHPGELAMLQPVLERALQAAKYPIHELQARRALLEVAYYQAHYQEAALHANGAIAAAERLLASETGEVRHRQAEVQLLDTLLLSFQSLRLGGDDAAARACVARAQLLAPQSPKVLAFTSLQLVDEVQQQLAGDGKVSNHAGDDGRVTAAIASLRQALSTSQKQPDLCYAMGRLQLLQDRQLEALKYFRYAIASDPQKVEAYLAAAQVCRQNSLGVEAERYARTGLLCRPDPQLRYELALALVSQLRMDDAIDNLELYVRMRPKDRDAARMLSTFICGKAIAGMGDKPHAELDRLLEQAARYNPAEPRIDIVRGKICRDRRQYAAAIEHLERAHAAFPDLEDTTSMLAQSYRDLGYSLLLEQKQPDEDGAIAAWHKFLQLAPAELDTEAVKMQLDAAWRRSEGKGVELLQQGDKAAAAAAFRRCLWIDPLQHWASWLLATAIYSDPATDLTELDRLTAAALSWQQQHKLDRSRQVLLRVMVLQKLQRQEAALQLVRDYLQAPDADADAGVMALLQKAGGG